MVARARHAFRPRTRCTPLAVGITTANAAVADKHDAYEQLRAARGAHLISCVSAGAYECDPGDAAELQPKNKKKLPSTHWKPETVRFARGAGSSLATTLSRRLGGSARRVPNTDHRRQSVYSKTPTSPYHQGPYHFILFKGINDDNAGWHSGAAGW